MKTVAIFSLKGGTGRTTIACNLGDQLTAQGFQTVVVDADPQNAVGLHYGMQVGEPLGMCRLDTSERDLEEYRRRTSAVVPYIPFGHAEFEDVQELEQLVAADPSYLNRRITELTPSDTDLVIVDTPAGPSNLSVPLVLTADLVLIVLEPDGMSYATIPATEELLARRTTPAIVSYLVNGMDGRKQLCVDVKGAMENMLREYLLPFAIPMDESVREAASQQTTLLRYSPDSYAAHGYRKLAQWLAGNLLEI